jgi:hypothetical protein
VVAQHVSLYAPDRGNNRAVGLVLMVFSGLYLWMGQPTKRRLGAAALLAGTITCGMFVSGLRLIY